MKTIEVEQALLAAVLLDGPKIIDELGERFRPSQFCIAEHRHIAYAMLDLAATNKPIDALTIHSYLSAQNITIPIHFIVGLHTSVGVAGNVEYYAQAISDGWRTQRAQSIGAQLNQDGDIQKALSALNDLDLGTSGSGRLLRDVELDLLTRLDAESKEKVSSLVSSGFVKLDEFIGGFRPGLLYVFAARPGSGKSSLAAGIAANLGEQGVSTTAFWLEDDESDFACRLLQRDSGLSSVMLRNGKYLDGQSWEKLGQTAERHVAYKICVDGTHGLDAKKISARMRQYAREYGTKVFILDHLGEVALSTEGAWDKHHLALGQLARIYRDTAKDLGAAAILFCQMNRSIERRTDSKPQLMDIEGSDQVGQVARFVGFVRIAEGQHGQDDLWVDVVKNTKGPKGSIRLRWHRQSMAVLNHETH